MNVVVILPTYNERENIEKLIPLLEEKIFPEIKGHTMSILVADDNSPDDTGKSVKKLMKKWKNIELSSGPKKGLGAAYIRGMTHAIDTMQADVMFEMDADGQHDPTKISEFLKKIENGCDMVIGTRYSNGGSIPTNWPPQRKAFSILANFFVRTVFMRFSIHDWTGGYRALKKEVFMREKKELGNYGGYIFQISFLHKAIRDGFKIAEIPFEMTDRTLGKSKIVPLDYIYDILKYVMKARIIEILSGSFGKFLVVGFIGLGIHAFTLRTLVEGFGWRPSIASLVGAAFAIFSNYNLNNLWTFGHEKARSVNMYIAKLIQFYATSSFGVIFIQTGTIFLGENLFGHEYYFIYFIVGTLLLLVWNFTIYSKIIWKKKPTK